MGDGKLQPIPTRLFSGPGSNEEKAWKATVAVMQLGSSLTAIARDKPPRNTNDLDLARRQRWIRMLASLRKLLAEDIGFQPYAYEDLEDLALHLSEIDAGRTPPAFIPRNAPKGGGTKRNEFGVMRRIMLGALVDVIVSEEGAGFSQSKAAKRIEIRLRDAKIGPEHFALALSAGEPLHGAFLSADKIIDHRKVARNEHADEFAAFIELGKNLGSEDLLARITCGRSAAKVIEKSLEPIFIGEPKEGATP